MEKEENQKILTKVRSEEIIRLKQEERELNQSKPKKKTIDFEFD